MHKIVDFACQPECQKKKKKKKSKKKSKAKEGVSPSKKTECGAENEEAATKTPSPGAEHDADTNTTKLTASSSASASASVSASASTTSTAAEPEMLPFEATAHRSNSVTLRQTSAEVRAKLDRLAASVIGERVLFEGPFGQVPIVYADFTGSGRFVSTIENWLLRFALPFYSNTHTETSSCGLFTGELREDARNVIRVGSSLVLSRTLICTFLLSFLRFLRYGFSHFSPFICFSSAAVCLFVCSSASA